MRLKEFDYILPEDLIAQYPAEPRDSSRLMVVHRDSGRIENRIFRDIADYLGPGDMLVLNSTKVVPARLLGNKMGSRAEAEILLLRTEEQGLWSCLVRPGRRLRPGSKVEFAGGLSAEIIGYQDRGRRLVRFSADGRSLSKDELFAVLERVGHTPLPPYISRPEEISDRARYQTVYAQEPGAVAAPTAGLHFTPELLKRIEGRGTKIRRLLLQVGWGTFKPVEVDDIRRHRMDQEYYRIERQTAEELLHARESKTRVVAVGTTTVRALESFARTGRAEGWTDIFIYPPYDFQSVDALITNFHLPRSTLLMLVSALAGMELVKKAYAQAVQQRYRFYSYGDAMLII